MDVYHIWFDLRPGVSDVGFCESLDRYLGHLRAEGRIESWRTMRRKLGLGPAELGEFHVAIETRDLAQLDQAFRSAASRAGDVEGLARGGEPASRELSRRAIP
jgi:hypothetical protein